LDVYFGALFYTDRKQEVINRKIWEFLRKILLTFVTLIFLFGYVMVKYNTDHGGNEISPSGKVLGKNRESVNRFYELTIEIFDEPLDRLNQSYVQFFDSLNKFKQQQQTSN
jgi:hypothetical protein